MHLTRLKLTNFRKFRDLEASFSRGLTIIAGGNAQGKSTLLEAIYLLAISKSARAAREREVINWQAAEKGEYAVVDGTITSDENKTRIIIGYRPYSTPLDNPVPGSPTEGVLSFKKTIKVEGIKKSASELVGLVRAVLFSADDIDLVLGPPATRRRYLDILVCQMDPLYLQSLQKYQRILLQRNRLLRLIREGRAEYGELDFWSLGLAGEGARIARRRDIAIQTLSPLARDRLAMLTDDVEKLDMNYVPNVTVESDEQLTERGLLMALDSDKQRDVNSGSTTRGPHRDELSLKVNGVDMSTFSSRGQARTIALALRLAEASYISQQEGNLIILLDDALSELDGQRRGRVMDFVQGYSQTIITTTDLPSLSYDSTKEASVFEMKDGVLKHVT